jgi:hypothetical protein
MTTKPGEVMGYLAFGHPFLDGNGPRTIGAFSRSLTISLLSFLPPAYLGSGLGSGSTQSSASL